MFPELDNLIDESIVDLQVAISMQIHLKKEKEQYFKESLKLEKDILDAENEVKRRKKKMKDAEEKYLNNIRKIVEGAHYGECIEETREIICKIRTCCGEY